MARNRRANRNGRRPRSVLWWLWRFAMLALLLLLAGFGWFVLAAPGPADIAVRTDGVAVLTGGPGRSARGLEVMQAGSAERMLISGVDRVATPEEVRLAAGISPQMFACCVDLGFVAEDTRSNAAEVASWARKHKMTSIRLVTSSFHMQRARAEIAVRLGTEVQILADGVPQPRPLLRMVEEYLKLVVSRAMLLMRPPSMRQS
jgi:uncharacterized SAM-binding protein YcdF (DUF218 family)